MKKTETTIRFLLALTLAVFGADKFLHFMPPPEAPPEGGAFIASLVNAGYVLPAIGLTFLATAACLLSGRVALGLIILTPISLNIFLYHLRFDMAGIGAGAVIVAMQLVLFWAHRREFVSLTQAGNRGAKHGP